MKTFKATLAFVFCLLVTTVHAHVPFLKPNMFQVIHNRLQIESSFTEFPFQVDYSMRPTTYWLIDNEGKQTKLKSKARTILKL